ncbi:LppU/SCO3897 family protein [Streptomyces sp. NPDC002867]
MSAPTSPSAPQDPQQIPQGQPDAAPAPQPAKKGIVRKLLGVVVLIVVAVAVKLGAGYILGDAPVRAEAGDCVQVTGPDDAPEVETKKCGEKGANYKVVKVIENSFDVNACTVGEAALAQQWDADKFVLCLDPAK